MYDLLTGYTISILVFNVFFIQLSSVSIMNSFMFSLIWSGLYNLKFLSFLQPFFCMQCAVDYSVLNETTGFKFKQTYEIYDDDDNFKNFRPIEWSY